MTSTMSFLDSRVISVFMTDKVCRLDITAVRILAFSVKNFFVQFDVVVVNGIIESDRYHHGDIFCGETAGNCGAILGAEAIRQDTDSGVARWGTIGVIVDICPKIKIESSFDAAVVNYFGGHRQLNSSSA